MNLLQKLKSIFKHDTVETEPVAAPPSEPPALAIEPKGHVVTTTKKVEYDPTAHRHGGRIVKAMPRELKKIKEAQEKIKG
jgi:hypothetical protein